MAYLLKNKDIEKAALYLGKYLPESAIVHQVVQRIRDGNNPGYNVWSSTTADNSPSFNVIVVSEDREKCENSFYRNKVYMFCTDPKEIASTLLSPGVLNFCNERITFYAISDEYLDYLPSIEERYEKIAAFNAEQFCCFSEIDTSQYQLPDCFKTSSITMEDLDTVKEVFWGTNLEGGIEVLQDLVDWNSPSICVHNEDNKPIAWTMKNFYGDQGSLYVSESYRQKGIGKYLVANLANMLIKKEGYAFASIHKGNIASVKLHEAVGFTRNTNLTFTWAVYSLKQEMREI